jgi:Zn-dependent peptidase ImmA (M78 family)
MPGKDTNTGAKRAREARRCFGIDDVSPVPCVLTLVEQQARLPVIVGALPDGLAGALWRNGVGSIVWVNGAQVVPRQRFTVAHELGHVRCGHEDMPADTHETISGQTGDPREVQANAFAAELLAPRRGVEKLVGRDPTLEDVVRLAAHFGISAAAGLYRCSTLELLTKRRYEQLRAEIDEGLHHDVWKYLDPEPIRDVLADTGHPRLPPAMAGSALAALLRGEASAGAAASAAGCGIDAARLAAAVAALSR